MRFYFYKVTTVLLMLTILLSCSTTTGGLTYTNFLNVKKDMTEQEVIDILGEPTNVTSVNVDPGTVGSIFGIENLGGTNMIWKTDNAKANVIFFQGKVKSSNFTNQF